MLFSVLVCTITILVHEHIPQVFICFSDCSQGDKVKNLMVIIQPLICFRDKYVHISWKDCEVYMLQSEPENYVYQILLDRSNSTNGHLSILVLTGEI